MKTGDIFRPTNPSDYEFTLSSNFEVEESPTRGFVLLSVTGCEGSNDDETEYIQDTHVQHPSTFPFNRSSFTAT